MDSRLFGAALALAFALSSWAADPTVSNLSVKQRYPWNGLVDIECDIAYTDANADLQVSVAATVTATGEVLPVHTVSQAGGSAGTVVKAGRRHFIWDAGTDVPGRKFEDVTYDVMAALKPLGGVQLWENGPYWAECNVGASQPEEYGYYFWWGDTVGYRRNTSDDGWVSVRDGTSFSFSPGNCPTYNKSNSQLQSAGYIDASGNLVAAHDAATAHLGAPWRMPTDAEWDALISNCDTEWTTRNGVYGRLVTGRGSYASKSIFLPAAGYGYGPSLNYSGSNGNYWSSTPNSDDSYRAWYLRFNSGDFGRDYYNRCFGQSVRPLRVFADEPSASYTVAFNANGGTGTMADEAFTYGTAKPLTANAFTRAGYTFGGWATSANGSLVYTDGQFVSNLTATAGGTVTLYAAWNPLGSVQLWAGGPYWAECNVGASQPEEYGYYFWWGDTVGYRRNTSDDGWVSVKDGTSFSFGNCPTYGKSISQLQSAGYIDSTGNLVAAHDAATAHLGAPWRMPTDAEWDALISNCDTEWTTRNGVYGRLVKGRGAYASKSIFLPPAGSGFDSSLYNAGSYGKYWSSTPNSDYSYLAWYLFFYSGNFYRELNSRYGGQSVRPLRVFAQ